MGRELGTDAVDRYVEAAPEDLYDIVADVTRTPELTPDVLRAAWLDGATGPAVGARFVATNKARRGPAFRNRPVVVAAERGREFAFARTEVFVGTLEWRYTFAPEGTGTRVTESYAVTRPISAVGGLILWAFYGRGDRRAGLRASMTATLDRLATLAERPRTPTS